MTEPATSDRLDVETAGRSDDEVVAQSLGTGVGGCGRHAALSPV